MHNAPLHGLLGFLFRKGNAEALDRLGGKAKHHLIAHFLSNTSAQNYRNRIVCVKIIASRKWDVFETQCVYTVSQNTSHLWLCCNLDTHDPITIIFSRSVTKKVRNQMMMLCFPTSTVYCFCTTLQNSKPRNCVFSLKHYVALPTNTQNTFKLSPGRCWITPKLPKWSTVCIRQLKPT